MVVRVSIEIVFHFTLSLQFFILFYYLLRKYNIQTNKQTFYFDITERQQNKETERIVCIKLSTERIKTEENCATVSKKKNVLTVKKKNYSREKKIIEFEIREPNDSGVAFCVVTILYKYKKKKY